MLPAPNQPTTTVHNLSTEQSYTFSATVPPEYAVCWAYADSIDDSKRRHALLRQLSERHHAGKKLEEVFPLEFTLRMVRCGEFAAIRR